METLLPNPETQPEPEISGIEAGAWVGRQQAFAHLASHCQIARARCLKNIRETHAYRQFGVSWNEFCPQYAGISRVHAEALIHRLEEFGESYFKLSELVRISPETYRQIAGQIHDGVLDVDGQSIPLNRENVPFIRTAIRSLVYRLHAAESRTDPSITEVSVRLDALFRDVAQKMSHTLGIDELVALRSMSETAARRWRSIFRKLSGVAET